MEIRLPSREDIDRICESRERYAEALDKRYKECDAEGHNAPDEIDNRCGYCHRSLIYITEADRILEERRMNPFYMHPIDAPLLMDLRKRDLEHIKFLDKLHGLNKLAEESLASSA